METAGAKAQGRVGHWWGARVWAGVGDAVKEEERWAGPGGGAPGRELFVLLLLQKLEKHRQEK